MTENFGIKITTQYDGSGVKKAQGDIGKLSGVSDKASESTGKLSGGFSALSSTVGRLIAAGVIAKVGQQLLALGSASVQVASDVAEMESQFNIVFGQAAPEAEAALQSFADAAGRSIYDLKGFASSLQDTFVPLGYGRQEAAKMSVELVKLAEDLASFKNLRTEDVVRDLQSALVGNTETLRKYGVVATQAAIDEKALAMGFEFTKGAMDAQTKAATILQLIMEGTADAQGDAIRTADGYANKTRAAEAATTELKKALGDVLMPLAAVGQTAKRDAALGLASLVEQMGLVEKATAQANLMLSTQNYNKLAGQLRHYGLGWRFVNEELGKVDGRFDLFRTEQEKLDEALMAQEGAERLSYALELLQNGFEGTNEELVAAVDSMMSFLDATEMTNAEMGAWESRIKYGEQMTVAMAELAKETEDIQGVNWSFIGQLIEEETHAANVEERIRQLAGGKVSYAEAMEHAASVLRDNFMVALQDGAMEVENYNSALLSQLDAMGASPEIYGLAAIALGEYDKEQIEAALNAAIVQQRINELATEFNNGTLSASDLRLEMEALASGEYLASVDVDTRAAHNKIAALRSELDSLAGRGVGTIPANVDDTTPTGEGSPTPPPTKDNGKPGYAVGSGGWLTVPPGFSGDTYPVYLSSGEQFNVVPRGQSGGDSVTIDMRGSTFGSGVNPAIIQLAVEKAMDNVGRKVKARALA